MDENERIDRGTWWPDGGDSVMSGEVLSGLPKGDYRIYAERATEKSLEERMVVALRGHWRSRWSDNATLTQERRDREETEAVQVLIDHFGLVERSELPEPVEVPDWVRWWLDNNIGVPPALTLKAWVREAVISGAVRVEKTEVPGDVLEAARWVKKNWQDGTRYGVAARWVLEQAGETDG